MATRKAKQAPKEGILIQSVDIKAVNRTSVDIKKWRDALKSAETDNENRKNLYELYADAVLDGHLTSVMNKRIMAITNADLIITKDGVELDGLDFFLKSKKFKKILRWIIEAKLYGHSLVEFVPTPGIGVGFDAELIDRRHVKPRLGIVVKNPSDTTGEPYREPPYYDFTLEVGDKKDFGLLLQASQYVIYKRGGFGDWADYIQRYGVPMLHGKYKNDETRKTLFDILSNMGSSGVAVTPEDALIEVLRAEGATGANLVFSNFKKACNDEMSVTILGQTMTTTDSGNAGYAQGKVHADVEAGIHYDDMLDTLAVLNSDLIRILVNLGYPVDGALFTYPDIDDIILKDRITIDEKLAKLIPMGKAYFYDRYKVPIPEAGDIIEVQVNTPQNTTEPTKKQGKKLNADNTVDVEILEKSSFWKKLGELLFS